MSSRPDKPDKPPVEEIITDENLPVPVVEEVPVEEVVEKEKPVPVTKDGKVEIERGTQYIVQTSDLVKEKDTDKKFVTITITPEIMHFLHAGLGKYKEGFMLDTESDKEERDKVNKIIDELETVKNTFTEEKINKTKGTQEPNPVEMTEGVPE